MTTLRLQSAPIGLALLATSLCLGTSLAAQCVSSVSSAAFNTTWTTQNSPYCVTQSIQVANLTIQPGVEVLVAPGASIQVVTWLRALGTKEHPIVFRAQNLAAGRWSGIEFTGPVAPQNPSQLTNCVVTGSNNAGIRILNNEQVTLTSCSIRDNTRSTDGGGVVVQLSSGSLALYDCDIEGNRANRHGGGVFVSTIGSAAVALVGCRVQDNLANPSNSAGTFLGAGIRSSGNLVLDGCMIAGNTVSTSTCGGGIVARGGGLYADNGDVALDRCVILGNTCSAATVASTCGGQSGLAEGAGVFADATVGNLALHNTLVCCNSAQVSGPATTHRGSGIQTSAASTTIQNCTIARNSDEGLRVSAGTTSVLNTIVYFHPVVSIQGSASVCYSDIQGGFAGCTGNFDFNPAFAGSGCVPEHFALLPFSPCIDAGDPSTPFHDACRPPAGGTVRNDVGALGGPGNCSFSSRAAVVCSAQTYGDLRNGQNALTLDWTFLAMQSPFLGTLAAGNGTPGGPALLLLGFQPGSTVLSGVTILMNPAGIAPLAAVFDGTGSFSAQLSLELPFLAGLPIFLQFLDLPPSGAPRGSNGVRLAPCF